MVYTIGMTSIKIELASASQYTHTLEIYDDGDFGEAQGIHLAGFPLDMSPDVVEEINKHGFQLDQRKALLAVDEDASENYPDVYVYVNAWIDEEPAIDVPALDIANGSPATHTIELYGHSGDSVRLDEARGCGQELDTTNYTISKALTAKIKELGYEIGHDHIRVLKISDGYWTCPDDIVYVKMT